MTDVTRDLVRDIIDPTLPAKLHVPLRPALAVHRLAAIGMTPPSLRDQLDLDWSPRQQRRLDRVLDGARAAFAFTPRSARTFPGWLNGRYLLWLARRHVRQFDGRLVEVAA